MSQLRRDRQNVDARRRLPQLVPGHGRCELRLPLEFFPYHSHLFDVAVQRQ
ncbi:MAG: hypothetical protein R3B90_07205 [Planctomycetaceae bacterium]